MVQGTLPYERARGSNLRARHAVLPFFRRFVRGLVSSGGSITYTLPSFTDNLGRSFRDSLMTSALEGCVAYSTANARIDSAGNEVVRAPPRRVLDVGCGSGHWMLGQAYVRGWEETEFVGKTEESHSRCSENSWLSF